MMKNRSAATLIIGLSFLLLGPTFLFIGKNIVREAKESMSWPSVKGRIVESRIEKKIKYKYDGREKKREVSYIPHIGYEYMVDGQHYSGSRVSFNGISTTYWGAKRLVDRYPENKMVDVHYNPDNPKNAVLEPGASLGAYIPLFIGFIFTVVGIGVVFPVERWRKNPVPVKSP